MGNLTTIGGQKCTMTHARELAREARETREMCYLTGRSGRPTEAPAFQSRRLAEGWTRSFLWSPPPSAGKG